MDEEKIKEAFANVKQDILKLTQANQLIRDSLVQTINHLSNLNSSIQSSLNKINLDQNKLSTQLDEIKTSSTDISTLRQEIKGLRSQILGISIGNKGVSTDRQTDTSTDTSTEESSFKKVLLKKEDSSISKKIIQESPIKQASELLENLDNLKKEVRLKIKRLTHQEMRVFTLLYQLDNQGENVDYSLLANQLNLTQSSIRDYIQRMIIKGIPVDKEKIDNKKIILHISEDLRKIASLETVMKLREI